MQASKSSRLSAHACSNRALGVARPAFRLGGHARCAKFHDGIVRVHSRHRIAGPSDAGEAMNGTRGSGWFVIAACALLTGLAVDSVLAQPAAPPPLPDGYMRAPAVPAGLAPKMRVTETTAAAHVFDANFTAGDEIMSGLTDLILEHNITSRLRHGTRWALGRSARLGRPRGRCVQDDSRRREVRADLAARPHRGA